MQRLVYLILGCSWLMNPTVSLAQEVKTDVDNSPIVIRKTTPAITPATYKGRQVAVGSGGGFTGFSTTYYLLDNGMLFGKRSRDTTFTPIGSQTVANTRRVFATVEGNCNIKTTRFNNPGNTYKFVQWQKARQVFKVTWGGTGKPVPANYPRFYESFMAMIPGSLRLK